MKSVIVILIVIMWGALPVQAQNLIPATSEDLTEFDRQVSESLANSRGSTLSQEAKAGREFGQAVAAEAKKLGSGSKGSVLKAEKTQSLTSSASKAHKEKANKETKDSAPGRKKK